MDRELALLENHAKFSELERRRLDIDQFLVDEQAGCRAGKSNIESVEEKTSSCNAINNRDAANSLTLDVRLRELDNILLYEA